MAERGSSGAKGEIAIKDRSIVDGEQADMTKDSEITRVIRYERLFVHRAMRFVECHAEDRRPPCFAYWNSKAVIGTPQINSQATTLISAEIGRPARV